MAQYCVDDVFSYPMFRDLEKIPGVLQLPHMTTDLKQCVQEKFLDVSRLTAASP
jgi:hypothetical protein